MVEFLMVFALGWLAASLLALLAVPALSRRADRLARRRAEAMFPVSVAEITAERDHVRAQTAISQRRAELRAEAVAAGKGADIAEVGRLGVLVHGLEATVAARDAAVRALTTDLAETRATLATTQARLNDTSEALTGERTRLGETGGRLSALSEEHRALTQVAAERQLTSTTLEARLESTQAELREVKRDLSVARDHLSTRDRELAERTAGLADAEARGAATLRRFDDAAQVLAATRARVEAMEPELAALRGSDTTLRRDFGERDRDAERLRAELAIARERIVDLEERLRATVAEARLAAGDVGGTIETLRAERGSLQAALDQARGDRTALRTQLAELQGRVASIPLEIAASPTGVASTTEVAGTPAALAAQTAELRARIEALADSLMAGSALPPTDGARSISASQATSARSDGAPATGRASDAI